jgi:chromosome segregation ATPase
MVNMADQPITTSIDDMVRYLNEHGETDSSTLAAALKVSEGIIETWADVLEKAQIVKVNYKLGKMFVSPMTVTKEGVEVAKKTVELKKGVAEAELASQINMINQVNTKLAEFSRYVSGAEGAFKSKAGQIKEAIDQIDKLSLQVDGAYKKLKEKKDYIDQLSAKLDKEAAEIEEKAKAASSISSNDSDSRRAITDIRAKLEDSEGRLKALNASMNSTLDQSRRNFVQLSESVKEEIKLLKGSLSQREKELQDYDSSLKSYRQESDAVKRQVVRERARMLDDIARASDDARRVYSVAERQIGDVKKTLGDMKSQFGGFATLSDNLNGIKNTLDSISKEKDELQKELSELQEQLKALSALDESKVAEKTMRMQQVEGRMNETGKKVEMVNKQMDDVKKGIDNMGK